MQHKVKSIRTFIGAKDYSISRAFYNDLGFTEKEISHNMCYFHIGDFGFYLQDSYVKHWVNNSMIFMEVDSTARYLSLIHI